MEMLEKRFRVPEIYGDYWFNSDPIPLGALRGYVILLDFWDYCSQSSLRPLPYLQEWYRRYTELGLVLIGVHTPEFPFARDPMNVRHAIEKYGVRYPVVMDNDYIIWSAFRNNVWPTKYLIDKNGYLRFVHAGEGSYQNFEHALQSLIVETGLRGDFPLVMNPVREADRPGALSYRMTPEILTGWQRGTIGNREGYAPGSTIHYEDPLFYVTDRLYLHGNWLNERNYLRLDEEEGREGYLVLQYQAKEVNVVLKPEGESKFQLFIQQDDAYLTALNKGDDVRIDEEVRSYLLVNEAMLYSVVKNQESGEHKLRMSTRSNGFSMYSISFVSSVIPEMITRN